MSVLAIDTSRTICEGLGCRANWEDLGPEFKPVPQGGRLGSETFRAELLAVAGERVGRSHYGSERREMGATRAQRLLKGDLRALGWTERELCQRARGDKEKVVLARRLRTETTMTRRWIAGRLQMDSWTCVSNLLREKTQQTISVNSEDSHLHDSWVSVGLEED